MDVLLRWIVDPENPLAPSVKGPVDGPPHNAIDPAETYATLCAPCN